jgi:hypothetical protein
VFGRLISFPLKLTLVCMLVAGLVPGAAANLALEEPTPPPPPENDRLTLGDVVEAIEDPDAMSSQCVPTACVLEHSGENADCEFGRGSGINNNATHIFVASAVTYTLVTGFDACASGEWWQEYRGILIAQHAPGLRAEGGGYTITSDGMAKTQYFVLVDTSVADLELRWMGTETKQDTTCAMTLAAKAPVYRLYDSFPCPVPPPDAPAANWGHMLP